MVAAWLRKDAGYWQHGTTAPAQGQALDPGDGSRTIFDSSAEWFAVSDGAGGFLLASSGTAAGVLTDDGAGGLITTAVGPGVIEAGRFLPDSRGDVCPVRNDTAELLFASVGGNINSY